MDSIAVNSIFKIIKNFSLSEDEEKILNLCYAPILKANASHFYRILCSLDGVKLNNNNITIDQLCMISSLDKNEIARCFSLLEAIKLITTYRKEETNVVYYIVNINHVYSSNKFFNEYALSTILINRTNNQYYQQVKQALLKDNNNIYKDYEKLDTNFVDYFGSDLFSKNYLVDIDNELHTASDDETIKNNIENIIEKKIDLKEFKKALCDCNYQLTFSIYKENVKDIINLINMYNLDKDTYTKLLFNATTDKLFSYQTFLMSVQRNALSNFDKKNQKNLVTYSSSENLREENEVKFVPGSSEYVNRINKIIATPTLAYLEKKCEPLGRGSYKSALKVFEYLKNNYLFEDPTINVIFDYCYTYKKPIKVNYIDVIANSITSKQLKNAAEVADYLHLNQQNISKKANNSLITESKTKKKKSSSMLDNLEKLENDSLSYLNDKSNENETESNQNQETNKKATSLLDELEKLEQDSLSYLNKDKK